MGGVDRQYLVANEAMALMSMMRKSHKWVQSGISAILGSEDEPLAARMGLRSSPVPGASSSNPPLVQGFNELCNGKMPSSACDLLAPFLRIVRSPHTSGTLTLRALIAVEKLLAHVLDTSYADLGESLYQVAVAITHCRFEAHDHAENDAVLHQIMTVMVLLVCGRHGRLLCNQGLCEVMETCMSMACHMRRGELLLRNASQTLSRMLVSAFEGMPEGSAQRLGDRGEVTPSPGTPQPIATPLKEAVALESGHVSPAAEAEGTEAETEGSSEAQPSKKSPDSPAASETKKEAPAQPPAPPSYDPFDASGLLQVFKVMVSLLEPTGKYSDKTRLMVVQLLCRVFETAGVSVSHDPKFVDIISSRLFKYIAQIARQDSPLLVAEALRLCTLVAETGTVYSLQLQFVLVYLLRSLSPLTDLPRDANIDKMFYDGVPSRPSCVKLAHSNQDEQGGAVVATQKSPEIREIMVEAIARMVHTPHFLARLFVDYDCNVQQENLCQDLLGFLCRNAYPDTATWSTASVPPLCLESVLSLLNTMHASIAGFDPQNADKSALALLETKSRKAREIKVAELFNESPKKGIKYAVEHGVIASDSPAAIAEFLHASQRLNGAALGVYLAKHVDVYKAFLGNFDFTNQRLDESLRELLAHLRLPGESGPIESLMDNLAEYYVGLPHEPKVVQTKDAAFILYYAIIMLNTNLYNPQVKSPMTLDAFSKQVKGFNGDGDFPEDYVRAIYEEIARHEIVFPAEHDNDESFERSWNSLELAVLAGERAPGAAEAPVGGAPPSPAAINAEIFAIMWKPIVSTLAFIFATATDDLVFSRVISGIQRTATLASTFRTPGALDHIVECLGKISILGSGDLAAPAQNLEVRIEEHSVIVSDLSVAFGSDLKAQMASITLFRVLRDVHLGNLEPAGWQVLGRILCNLWLYGLLEAPRVGTVKPVYTFERSKSGKNVGIFSALSSYLTAAADTPVEPSDEDVDAALGAQDCIKLCKLGDVLALLERSSFGSGVEGLRGAMPPSPTDEKYRPATSFLAHLVAQLSGPDQREDTLAYVQTLGLDAAVSANILLQLSDSVADLKLDPAALDQYAPALLRKDDPHVWTVLSQAPLETLSAPNKALLLEYAKTHVSSQAPKPAVFETIAALTELDSEALELLYVAKDKLVQSDSEYLAFLRAAVQSCTVSSATTRERALDKLQSTVQTFGTAKRYDLEWQTIYEEAIIPLLDTLLKPQVFKRDPKHMGATRERAASIACKTFLTYGLESASLEVWLKLLHVLDRLLGSRKQPSLHEGIAENLKNVILVLKSSDKADDEFCAESHKALKEWMPEVAELVSEPSERSEQGEEGS